MKVIVRRKRRNIPAMIGRGIAVSIGVILTGISFFCLLAGCVCDSIAILIGILGFMAMDFGFYAGERK